MAMATIHICSGRDSCLNHYSPKFLWLNVRELYFCAHLIVQCGVLCRKGSLPLYVHGI